MDTCVHMQIHMYMYVCNFAVNPKYYVLSLYKNLDGKIFSRSCMNLARNQAIQPIIVMVNALGLMNDQKKERRQNG